MSLRRLSLTLLLTFCVSLAASAQTQQAHGSQYDVTFGIGERRPLNLAVAEVGVGYEFIFRNGIGVGAEIAYLTSLRNFFGSGVGPVSFDASYHFPARDKLDPFVRGGYTAFVAFDGSNGMNFGGGLNYWFSDRTAVRVEFVDQVALESRTRHYLLARIGITFGAR